MAEADNRGQRVENMRRYGPDASGNTSTRDDLFERWAWLYALCRERIFTDHTEMVEKVMRERQGTGRTPVFLEVGCGPGFYSLSLAKRFPDWRVVGMDQCSRLLDLAREKAASKAIANCIFSLGDATRTQDFPEQADLVLASRLLLILPDRLAALRSMYAGLRPGGKLLIAEPLPGWRSRLALGSMGLLSRMGRRRGDANDPEVATKPLSQAELGFLMRHMRWGAVRSWCDGRYQYVLGEKPHEHDTNCLGGSAIAIESATHSGALSFKWERDEA